VGFSVPPKENLVGQKFNKLTVVSGELEKRNSGKNRWVWVCKCDCGKTTKVPSWNLISTKYPVRSCGCLKAEMRKLPGAEAALRAFYGHYRSICKYSSNPNRKSNKKEKEFLLTIEEFKSITGKHCHYCGCPPQPRYAPRKTETKETATPYLGNGIDRLDSNKGYTIDNCVPCCSTCNYMKRDFVFEDFIRQCRRIADFTRGEI
jgi:hypothetical protein